MTEPPANLPEPPAGQVRFPLFARILGWFFLNLLLIALLVQAFFKFEFQLGFDSLLLGQTDERIRAVREVLAAQLNEVPTTAWDGILQRFSEAYQVTFYLLRSDAQQVAGDPVVLPEAVRRRLAAWGTTIPDFRGPPWRRGNSPRGRGDGPGNRAPGPPYGPRRGGGPRRMEPPSSTSLTPAPGALAGNGPNFEAPRAGPPLPEFRRPAGPLFSRGPRPQPYPRFVVRTSNPEGYWVGVRIPVFEPAGPGARASRRPLTLLARSSTWRGVLFSDPLPWLLLGSLVIVASVLFWLPMVRRITRDIRRLTQVTERIADGDLEARVVLARRDELGQLGRAINQMTRRLGGFVNGQRRFLGDVAHELCSPLARSEIALGILESRTDEAQLRPVRDLQEEVRHMSGLVQELLSFARASAGRQQVHLRPVALRAAIEAVVRREARDGADLRLAIPAEFEVLADPELLRRSVGNLVRNAIRYAGHAGPITISADAQEQGVVLVVGDSGPGIPEEQLEQVFDPFYRLEAARDRESGGAGLGLAIVKTCIEAMGGRVHCRNRRPRGLEVALSLQRTGLQNAPAGAESDGGATET